MQVTAPVLGTTLVMDVPFPGTELLPGVNSITFTCVSLCVCQPCVSPVCPCTLACIGWVAMWFAKIATVVFHMHTNKLPRCLVPVLGE